MKSTNHSQNSYLEKEKNHTLFVINNLLHSNLLTNKFQYDRVSSIQNRLRQCNEIKFDYVKPVKWYCHSRVCPICLNFKRQKYYSQISKTIATRKSSYTQDYFYFLTFTPLTENGINTHNLEKSVETLQYIYKAITANKSSYLKKKFLGGVNFLEIKYTPTFQNNEYLPHFHFILETQKRLGNLENEKNDMQKHFISLWNKRNSENKIVNENSSKLTNLQECKTSSDLDNVLGYISKGNGTVIDEFECYDFIFNVPTRNFKNEFGVLNHNKKVAINYQTTYTTNAIVYSNHKHLNSTNNTTTCNQYVLFYPNEDYLSCNEKEFLDSLYIPFLQEQKYFQITTPKKHVMEYIVVKNDTLNLLTTPTTCNNNICNQHNLLTKQLPLTNHLQHPYIYSINNNLQPTPYNHCINNLYGKLLQKLTYTNICLPTNTCSQINTCRQQELITNHKSQSP